MAHRRPPKDAQRADTWRRFAALAQKKPPAPAPDAAAWRRFHELLTADRCPTCHGFGRIVILRSTDGAREQPVRRP